jgi:uncharacterized Zn finger protein
MSWYHVWEPRPTVAERKHSAKKQIAALEKKGQKLSPVVLPGRTIAGTFWGKAWCQNLESYSDYSNRLPRGRSYVRSGSVLDLSIAPGEIKALVQGTRLYRVTITITNVEAARWSAIVAACSGQIDSVVELLQGKLSKAVMEVITSKDRGLFPAPKEIKLACSCPDWAGMCKHVAAVLYGVGARLDTQPDLLFRLRGADPLELTAGAARGAVLGGKGPAKEKRLGADLANVFGIDLDLGPAEPAKAPKAVAAKAAVPKAAAPKASATPRRRKKQAAEPATVSREELHQLGVPKTTVAYWVRTGVLVKTAAAGVFEQTAAFRERVLRYEAGAERTR